LFGFNDLVFFFFVFFGVRSLGARFPPETKSVRHGFLTTLFTSYLCSFGFLPAVASGFVKNAQICVRVIVSLDLNLPCCHWK